MILSLIAAAAISASCAWDNPRGTYAVTAVKPSALVDNYRDIPAPVRDRIKARMDALKYDEVVEIRKESIKGEYAYSGLRDMHFGASGGKVCREVSLANWTPADVERALIYCEGGHCLAVPTVCRNVSRITRGPRLLPPPGIPPEPVSGGVGPVPVAAPVTIPDVEPGPLADVLPPQSFARLSVPETPRDEYPDRISAELTMFDLWQWRPLFGPVPTHALVPMEYGVAGPVPGVKPPDASVMPDGGAPVAPVPEPSTYVLMALGLAWVAWQRRRAANAINRPRWTGRFRRDDA